MTKHGETECLKVFKPKQGSNSCHLCEFKSKISQGLRNHVKRMHGVEELKKRFKLNRKDTEHSCHVCEFKTTVKTNLKRHIGSEHGENELRSYKLKDQREWKKQYDERKKEKEKESSNVCPHCGEVSIFSSLQANCNTTLKVKIILDI